jgi:putative NADH-flavin reductase
MPVIVIGADTRTGLQIVERLTAPGRELRAFVSSADVGDRLRQKGVKVALGDLSDQGHVAAACTNCFSAVLIVEAATDGRELSFAQTPRQVIVGWSASIKDARVRRAIWVGGDSPPTGAVPEEAFVSLGPDISLVAERVAALDEAAAI